MVARQNIASSRFRHWRSHRDLSAYSFASRPGARQHAIDPDAGLHTLSIFSARLSRKPRRNVDVGAGCGWHRAALRGARDGRATHVDFFEIDPDRASEDRREGDVDLVAGLLTVRYSSWKGLIGTPKSPLQRIGSDAADYQPPIPLDDDPGGA